MSLTNRDLWIDPSETERELRKKFRLTILIIEHDMDVIMRDEVDKIYVANDGAIIVSGKPDQIKSDQQVINAYLGR